MSQSLLSNLERDALKECVNIGAGHAATALSGLTQEKVSILVPKLELVPVEDAPAAVGKPDEVMSAVVMKMGGDVSGTILLMFPTRSALLLSSLLLKSGRTKEAMGEDENSALREAGNILSGHALNAISQFLGFRLLQSVPETSSDMVGAMMNEILVHFLREKHENVLVLSVSFQISGHEIIGSLFFLFDPSSTRVILDSLRKKLAIDLG
ncbi:MAG TPA: chemotaxis protein CheC [Patescibacteria group bacterium]|nr:chemotaxis protein CheC [Patescibacteria group bacterium]